MFGECHAHIFMNGWNFAAAKKQYANGPDESDIREKLLRYAQAGIGFIRDGGDRCGASLLASRIAGEYGITYASPSFAIHLNGEYGAIVGRGFDTLREYAALVRQVREDGGDFVKIMASGILDFANAGRVTGGKLPDGVVREMIHIAHEEGFSVMVHVNGAENILAAIEGGAESIEHGNYMNADCIEALAQKKCIWVPTISTVFNLLGSSRYEDQLIKTIYADTAARIRAAYERGCVIALGSDAGAYAVPHVKGIEDEYRTMSRILAGCTGSEQADARFLEAQKLIQSAFFLKNRIKTL